ncbi:UbiD family decarboxylase [Shimia sp.]|uniref:UbiD family decarboxylase n=1 Tax=Shimia sp. TaxID=1954381 RepID=UPI0032969663
MLLGAFPDAIGRKTVRTLPPYPSLRSFLDHLDASGEVREISDKVSVLHQMTAVHRVVLEAGGPVLRFNRPILKNGAVSPIPVVTNLFGTTSRVAAGLGVQPDQLDDLGQFLAALKSPTPPSGLRDGLSKWPMLKAALATRPKLVKKAPVQQATQLDSDVDLTSLPVQTHWPGDAAPLITWPIVLTRPHDSSASDVSAYNAGVYRMQVLDKTKLIMRWLPHRGGAKHHQNWAKAGEKTPVAVVLGADPTMLLSAALPLPENVSELTFAGALNATRPRLVQAKSIPMQVPADAEIILEGWVSPTETAPEGPFGDHTGYYNKAEPFPVMHVTAITHRENPIYLSTYTGRPPDEPAIIGEVFNKLALPTIQDQIPEIHDIWLPPAACSYRMAVISIRKRYPGQARRVMMALWGMLPQFSYTKMIVVVDDDINPRNWDDVAWVLATRMDPGRDVMLLDNTPMDYLDFASPEPGLAGKIGLDATTKIDSETHRDWGKVMHSAPDDIAFAMDIVARNLPGLNK